MSGLQQARVIELEELPNRLLPGSCCGSLATFSIWTTSGSVMASLFQVPGGAVLTTFRPARS